MDASLHQDLQNLLTRFKEDENKWENHTKAEYIKRCDDIVAAQVQAGTIDIEVQAISSYLYKKLTDFGIQISDHYIRDIIPDTHTRNYNKSEITSELEEDRWIIISSDDEITETIEKNQYGEYRINGVEQKPREVKPNKELKVITDGWATPTTSQYIYLTAMSKLANKFHLTLDKLKERYVDKNDKIIIDKILGDCKEKLEQYTKDWASIETSKAMIDLRRDYGEYEKIMGAFMMNTGETIARIAQLMDYSEKYGSIGLYREPKVTSFFETETKYPLYLRSCPSCLTDISMQMNKNISFWRECQKLGIEFDPIDITIPTIKYS